MADETIKILSWNIQKFGATKLNSASFIKYVADVIIDSRADFVGLMEIVGWVGKDIKNQLLTELRQTGISWNGEESEMTPSKPHEQYVFLWKVDPCKQVEHKLYGIVGENAFDQLFKSYNFDAKKIELFWELLRKKKYLDGDYIVPEDVRESLTQDPNNFDLSPEITFDSVQKKALVDVLLADDAIGFPYAGSRPPFLASLKLEPNQTEMLITLYHAPGPEGNWPLYASNALAFMPEVRNATKSVIMGDFNVRKTELDKLVNLEVPGPNYSWVRVGGTAIPFQTLTGPAFPGNNPVALDYKRALIDQPTSLTTTLQSAAIIPNDITIKSIQSNPYDNFYTRGFTATEVKQKQVVPLIDETIPKTASTTTTTYSLTRSEQVALIFNEWVDHQRAKGIKMPDIVNPKKAGSIDKFAPNTVPANLREAHYAYRYAVSDHLPIFIELEYD